MKDCDFKNVRPPTYRPPGDRHTKKDRLVEIADHLRATGVPYQLTLRELLKIFGYQKRGVRALRWIELSLAQESLTCVPHPSSPLELDSYVTLLPCSSFELFSLRAVIANLASIVAEEIELRQSMSTPLNQAIRRCPRHVLVSLLQQAQTEGLQDECTRDQDLQQLRRSLSEHFLKQDAVYVDWEQCLPELEAHYDQPLPFLHSLDWTELLSEAVQEEEVWTTNEDYALCA